MLNLTDVLIDWSGFEDFVRDLYSAEGQVVVERHVTLKGKSGANREIDVLVTHRTRFHTYITVIECKYWKSPVSRDIIDVLYATLEDINASKGVLFTSKGYERGAIEYAKAKNIDLFIVRDLTEEEWGLPGRVVEFYMHFWCGKMTDLRFQDAKLIPVVRNYPTDLQLAIQISKDNQMADDLYLYSVEDGRRGPHLLEVLFDYRLWVLKKLAGSVGLLQDGRDGAVLTLLTDVFLDFSRYEFRQLRFPYGVVDFNGIECKQVSQVSQTHFRFDRGASLDLGLIVEDYLTRKRHLVYKQKGKKRLDITELSHDKNCKEQDLTDVLQNGTILQVFTAPSVDFDLPAGGQLGTTSPLRFSVSLSAPEVDEK